MWDFSESRAKLAARTLTPDSELALLDPTTGSLCAVGPHCWLTCPSRGHTRAHSAFDATTHGRSCIAVWRHGQCARGGCWRTR